MAHPQTNFSSNFQGVDPPLEGYWHDDPIPCGSGNVVTDIWPNPAGVPVVVKGFNALTAEDIVDKLGKTGDASNTTVSFSAASTRTNIASGEKLSVLFGKIAKWFGDLGTAAFKTLVTAWSGTPSDGNVPSEKLVKDSLDSKQDALPSISGKAGKVLKVNSGATGLEWATDDNTTYSQITRGSGSGLAPGLPSGSDTSKFLCEDGTWKVPNYPSVPSVVNNLNSTSTTDALSAAQGKTLNDRLAKTTFFGLGVDLILSKQTSTYDNDAACFRISYARGNNYYYDQLVYIQTPSAQSDISPLGGGSITTITDSLGNVLNAGYKIVDNTIEYHFYAVTTGNSVFRVYAGGGIQSVYSVSAGPHASDLTNLSYNKIYMSTYSEGGKGSPTTPVYVDPNGQVQPCTQGTTLKSNTATLYIAGYTDNNIPYYHVKDIKNGCVNHVHVKDIPYNTCSITIEAPALASGEEYDYVVVFDTFTNSNLIGSIDVENCKTAGHMDNGVFVVDSMTLMSASPRYVPMIIVQGNVASSKWYDRT